MNICLSFGMCLMADGAQVEQNGTFGTVVVLSKGFGFASLHIKNAMDCFTELLLSGKAQQVQPDGQQQDLRCWLFNEKSGETAPGLECRRKSHESYGN